MYWLDISSVCQYATSLVSILVCYLTVVTAATKTMRANNIIVNSSTRQRAVISYLFKRAFYS